MPHTKQEIVQFLAAEDIKPRHQWGQNFLIDLNLMHLLVNAAHLRGDEIVLEVGCGTGSLTGLLAEKAGAVITVEIDARLRKIANAQVGHLPNVFIIPDDVLSNKNTINPAVWESINEERKRHKGHFYLMANLPYQVSSPLIVNLLLGDDMPAGMFVTIQTEVGLRMVARPGEKEYGLLSILMQATGKLQHLRNLSPECFWPSPKVTSAMIAWHRDEEKCRTIHNKIILKKFIDLLLGHRRKKISSCLKHAMPQFDFTPLLQKAGVDPNARGETLSPQQFIQLANLWADMK
ncbi:MAG: ribosomal RNA small subunit methyltransferase A [Sedimentisphaerales bacterium]|nr:ribosomal RNA small subunit methyltransferase A [Sedimentisphaerales bacterium]